MTNDTRPRHPYSLPDGREIRVIADHGGVPKDVIDYELATGDPLWGQAKTRPGTQRRFVVAKLKSLRLAPTSVRVALNSSLNPDELLGQLRLSGVPDDEADRIVKACQRAVAGVLEAARW